MHTVNIRGLKLLHKKTTTSSIHFPMHNSNVPSLFQLQANRLVRENGQLGLISACAAGGQGVVMLLERHPDANAD